MSPLKSSTTNDDDQHQNSRKPTMMINPRPSPLKISRESQAIHKPSDHHNHHHQHIHQIKQRREPVIIYTHSPKIIHTQARDFMALVQNLTGLSREHSVENESSDAKSNIYRLNDSAMNIVGSSSSLSPSAMEY